MVKAGRAGDALARPDNPRAVPVLRETDGRAMARALERGGRITATLEGVSLMSPLPKLAAAILARIDGRRSLGEIHRALASAHGGGLDWLAFKAAFDRLYGALNGINAMLVSRPPGREA